MRRRERLTGFFIIFILLTFSAYSSSMNVGGRSGLADRQIGRTSQINAGQNSMRVLNNGKQKFNTAVSGTKEQLDKESDINSSQSLNTNSGRSDKSISLDQAADNVSQNFKNERKETKIVTEQREKNTVQNKKQDQQKTAFEKRYEPQLIDQVKVHKVKSGETLWDIAHEHGLNIDSLIGANNISNMNSIKPGQEFKILPVKGIIYRVSPGESVASIAGKFNIKTETIMRDNNLEDPSGLKIDQKLILRGAKPEFSYQDRLDQKFMYPINTRITSYYGPRWGRVHEGLDFAAPMGSPIRAVSSGRVVYSGWATGYGYVVIIEHQKGLRTLYAHNSKLLVRSGESVGKGEVISRSGNTGNSTGPHLHFEVQVNGRPENPLDYINR
ncbi:MULTISPECIES: M23 family metallopeptidase [Halanaerobium]|uniref:Murein DD-endopeptidase MepM and murein hydrolase activator NlpD, contain LysM domain n=1 Tax=Halanaerobium kushneri TaxID=56779 RepID=A0A1N6YE39_9FIRM|nr:MULTISPECIES: M23 family metallopeptidase [Halanaerobium]RCW50602.1 murein DD-endopeptidase MepM/ murein hydrolase activator NlpD [Halanaerobium sp. ST460_2HS_T2]SIR12830.1 Murein DD-endopeptidase MepM and murein hydrolase activator NlpD, contain LysM domain [Halanaerobium kushneri]